jgi:hypothetical protein
MQQIQQRMNPSIYLRASLALGSAGVDQAVTSQLAVSATQHNLRGDAAIGGLDNEVSSQPQVVPLWVLYEVPPPYQ